MVYVAMLHGLIWSQENGACEELRAENVSPRKQPTFFRNESPKQVPFAPRAFFPHHFLFHLLQQAFLTCVIMLTSRGELLLAFYFVPFETQASVHAALKTIMASFVFSKLRIQREKRLDSTTGVHRPCSAKSWIGSQHSWFSPLS